MVRFAPSSFDHLLQVVEQNVCGTFHDQQKANLDLGQSWVCGTRSCESLKSYIKKFTTAFVDIKDLNESFSIQAFKVSMANEQVYYALYNGDIINMHKLVFRAQSLVVAEKMRLSHIGYV